LVGWCLTDVDEPAGPGPQPKKLARLGHGLNLSSWDVSDEASVWPASSVSRTNFGQPTSGSTMLVSLILQRPDRATQLDRLEPQAFGTNLDRRLSW